MSSIFIHSRIFSAFFLQVIGENGRGEIPVEIKRPTVGLKQTEVILRGSSGALAGGGHRPAFADKTLLNRHVACLKANNSRSKEIWDRTSAAVSHDRGSAGRTPRKGEKNG